MRGKWTTFGRSCAATGCRVVGKAFILGGCNILLQCRWISREDMKAAVDASYSGAQYDSGFPPLEWIS